MEVANTAESITPTPVAPAIDLDANPLGGQVASAVLDLKGNIVQGKLPQNAASVLFAVMQETGQLSLQGGTVQRITVTLATSRYVVARDESHVYISQLRLG
mmetsp:Transcript_20848/g.26932  ORF Transcript_20848/g.26932 Transcript_20848/m.26932 type:complete len:101 (-) Transcript_20848:120-422(-)|eukprot:CAMPEP_0198136774 /NCGR_PEP_ID=MMETSP1443-20131203/384_1 /TAXON_ID=186043 /ORGANISM="Entomoneis sp., Strain CCMP2396" /LENGTH=100 /DNA_ID=CAMNT_0043798049 /DNA_START=144 /DNA_END=446 /DNA_ORIENTATION=+